MRILLLGRGHRILDLLDSVEARDATVVTRDETALRGLAHRRVVRIVADPTTVSFTEHRFELAREDMVIIADHEEASLRATLENARRQSAGCTLVVFTPLTTRHLARDFPEVYFRGDRTTYHTELREFTRRSSTRQKVAAIRQILTNASQAVTVIWGNPDPDSIGSAFALKELLAADQPRWTLCYTGEYTRPENLAMVRTLKIPTVKYMPHLITPETAVVTVDAQPSFFHLDHEIRFDIIIDHHPLSALPPHRFADIRPKYGSTCTILSEYYNGTGTRMSRRVATALFYGLRVDTNNLTRNISDPDVRAFRTLRMRADENMVRAIELTQLPMATLDHFSVALANKKIYRDVIFSYLGTIENPDFCVHVADFFIKISGIGWALVACRTQEKVIIIFRSDGFRKHAGHLAERLFAEFGTAGGHRTMARAELQLSRLAGLTERTDIALERWILDRLGHGLKPLARAGV